MKDLRPKIIKVLINTLKETVYSFDKDYTVYEKDGYIRVKHPNEFDLGASDDELCWIPPYDHNEAFSFICDGGYLWDLMNPCEAEYPNYEFEDTIFNNFEKAGLWLEPYASYRFDVSLDQ